MSELVSLLDDDVFAVRRAAARALGAVGDPRTVSALAAVLGRDTRRPALPPPGRSSASRPASRSPSMLPWPVPMQPSVRSSPRHSRSTSLSSTPASQSPKPPIPPRSQLCEPLSGAPGFRPRGSST